MRRDSSKPSRKRTSERLEIWHPEPDVSRSTPPCTAAGRSATPESMGNLKLESPALENPKVEILSWTGGYGLRHIIGAPACPESVRRTLIARSPI